MAQTVRDSDFVVCVLMAIFWGEGMGQVFIVQECLAHCIKSGYQDSDILIRASTPFPHTCEYQLGE